MADITKIWPIFRWANGGLSDDLFTGIRNSFFYSDQVEILENANCITPKAMIDTVSVELWAKTNIWAVKCIIPLSEWAYSALVFCERAVIKVVVDDGVATKYTLWSTTSNAYRICDAERFAWKLFFSTRDMLYYLDWDTAASATSAWSESDIKHQELNSTYYHPLYASDVCLCVWNKHIMQKIHKETIDTMQVWYEMQEDYTIRFINELWWYVRAVSDDGWYGSEVWLRDKSKKAMQEIIPLQWYKFLQSCIYGWYHYLLSDKWLGLLNGYQFYVVKKFKVDSLSADTITNWMCVYDDKLYYNRQVWTFIYGSKNKNYNDVLHQWKSRSDTFWQPYAMETEWRYLYTSEIKKNDNWVISTFLNIYDDDESSCYSWELQTMAYFWNSMSEIKQAQYLRVWYNIDTWWIKVYYRTNIDALSGTEDTWERHELTQEWWLKHNSDMRAPFATSLKLNCRFQWIQFKFELRWAVDNDNIGRKTRLYSADLYYNVWLD